MKKVALFFSIIAEALCKSLHNCFLVYEGKCKVLSLHKMQIKTTIFMSISCTQTFNDERGIKNRYHKEDSIPVTPDYLSRLFITLITLLWQNISCASGMQQNSQYDSLSVHLCLNKKGNDMRV